MSVAFVPIIATLLVVDDDDRIRRSLALALRDEGYAVLGAADADEALAMFRAHTPDLVLLDVLLPGMDGFDICRAIRRISAIPVIMVTARDDSHDVVAGLEAGADDYVTKPYNSKELAARIRALLRRSQGSLADASDAGPVRFGALAIDSEAGQVTLEGVAVELTRTEFRLLTILAGHRHKVLSRTQLLELVWGYDYFGDARVVDAHIRRLRAKLEPDPANPIYVVTVRGLGYKFDPPE